MGIEDYVNKVFVKSCKELTSELPDKSIDLILTDPPFNIASKNNLTYVRGKITSTKRAWGYKFNDEWKTIDDYIHWLLNETSEFKRILKENGSLIMFVSRYYSGYVIYRFEKKGWIFKNKIYFERLNPPPHVRKNNYRSVMDEAIWFTKTNKYIFNFLSQEKMKQVFYGNIGNKDTRHPTEKYVWMIEPLILRHSTKNSVILDPFCGSGTVCVISKKHKRFYIACDINKEYVEICNKRLMQEYLI